MGAAIVFERYDTNLLTAKRVGEIAVMARQSGRSRAIEVSGAWSTPHAAYNPAVSEDGRWVAFETAAGNLNFAKRYGEMRIAARDLKTGRVLSVSHPPGLLTSRSAYSPTISGDGRLVGYESYDARPVEDGTTRIVVHDVTTGSEQTLPPPTGRAGDLTEPELSADGHHLAYTLLGRDALGARSEVFVSDLRTGVSRRVSAPSEEAWQPSLSRDGSVVAFSADKGDGSRVVVQNRHGARRLVLDPGAASVSFEPALSADGRRVAFTVRPRTSRRTQVYMRDLRTGHEELVSRATGLEGAAGLGAADHPAISGDGRRVVFTSDAWNLSSRKCNTARGVFVRDIERARTALISVGDGANRLTGPTRGSSAPPDPWAAATGIDIYGSNSGSPAFSALMCPRAGRNPAET